MAITMAIKEFKQKTTRMEILGLSALILLTIFLRFFQLGYSNFYPDETKTFHMRKDIAITDFLLNQRKGPIQFLASWGAEKLFGGYDEFYTRLPFAFAGTLAVIAFYFLIKKLFGRKSALIAGFLFSLNGFFIAFGRTAQYQSFIFLFGFLALLATLHYVKEPSKQKSKIYLVSSAIFLSLSFLAHWDTVFIATIIFIILAKAIFLHQKSFQEMLLFFIVSSLIILSIFFVPYFTKGYFAQYTASYISNRVTGSKTSPSNSFTTFEMYNPYKIGAGILSVGILAFAILSLKERKSFLKEESILTILWFIFPFILFEIVFNSPGTHILNYIIPLIILVAYTFSYIDSKIHETKRLFFRGIVICAFCLYGIIQIETFIPKFNKGYPWNLDIDRNEIQLFLYGFPYNRGWDQIREYFKKHAIHNYYTNDNIVMSQFYLYGVYTKPLESLPEYYIYVYNNHQFSLGEKEDLNGYSLEETIYREEKVVAEIYKVAK
jgi:4-amino-4-deoxy-L-arabinose transferase-like glycosyltransferase